MLLNLTPDHQDRYANPDDYGAAKANLLRASGRRTTVAVLNRDDAWVWEQRRHTRASVLSFGRDPVEFGTFLDGDDAVVWSAGQPQRYDLADSPLRRRPQPREPARGDHRRHRLGHAAAPPSAPAMRATAALPHRLELVRERGGVRWYDDSKATNVGAVEKSLDSFPGGIVLLLGGYDKGGDFTALRPRLARARRAHDLLRQGRSGDRRAARRRRPTRGGGRPRRRRAQRRRGWRRAGQVVVLAPGCASFDEFRDYAERGQRFRALVEDL